MLTENASSQQAETGSANTNTIKQQMLQGLQSSKEYRCGFIEESIQSRLTAQINALRREQGWDLKTFAEKLGKKLSWVYRLEDPNAPIPTVPTLLEVAETFDIGLDVRFRRYSELLDDAVNLTAKSFSVPSFDAELKAGAFSRPVRKKHTRRFQSKTLSRKVRAAQKRPRRNKVVSITTAKAASAMSEGPNPEYLRGQYGIGKAS